MKITKFQKELFIDAIIAGIPTIDYKILATDFVQEAVIAGSPKAIQEA